MILEIFEIYHQEINPNTSCPWTISIILCGKICKSSLLWHWFHLLYFFQESGLFDSHVSSLHLVDPFDLFDLIGVLIDLGRAMILFVCILYSKEHS